MSESSHATDATHDASPGAAVAAIPFRLGRRPSIDGIRGVASLLVLGYHLAILSKRINAPAFGFNGVFFVLSGFLITAMLVEEWRQTGGINLRRFFARRALRLLPCLVLNLMATALVFAGAELSGFASKGMTHEEAGERWLTIAASLALMTNWALAFDWIEPGLLRGTWSLAVEQQFYLLWPPLLLLLLSRFMALRRMAIIAAVCALGVVIYREALWQNGTNWNRVYFGADTRADSILIGCAIGLLATGNLFPTGAQFRRLLNGAAIVTGAVMLFLVALLVAPIYGDFHAVDDTTIRLMAPMALMTGLVLVHLVVEPEGLTDRFLSARWLGLAGRLSYPTYLWHTFYLWLCARLFGFGDGPALAVLALTAVSVPITYYGVELPVMRLKDSLRTSPQPGAPQPLVPRPTSDHGSASPAWSRRLPRLAASPAATRASGVSARPRLARFVDGSGSVDGARDLAS